MARRSLGPMIDSSFFPEIVDERSKYESPLTAILTELRRKHVLAAAATIPHLNNHDSSIKDREEIDIFSNSDECNCHQTQKTVIAPRRASLFQSIRRDSLGSGRACPACGKRMAFDPIGDFAMNRNPRLRKTPNVLGSQEIDGIGAPQHAQALLESAPHLRHLSQASTDMQGIGNLPNPRGILGLLLPGGNSNQNNSSLDVSHSGSLGMNTDYRTSLVRQGANQQAASELAAFLSVLAHEMSLGNYGAVENEVFTAVFALVHSNENSNRMAGVAALDALIEAPSADEEKKAIMFANNLSSSLRVPNGDFEFLSAVSQALGHMAIRVANVDFVESEVTRALEWVRTGRSDRRLAAILTLRQLAMNAASAFYSKTSQSTFVHCGSNEFLDNIFPVLSDPQPIVRACAADALSQCLKILVERGHASLTALLCQVYFNILEGLRESTTKKSSQAVVAKVEATNHGCLLAVACMLQYTRDFMLPRFDEICEEVLRFTSHPKALVRLEIVRLVPRLAHRCPRVFGRRYLEKGLLFLLKCASGGGRVGVDCRPSAYAAIGQLIVAMSDEETGEVIGGSPSPTVKILNETHGDNPRSATVVVEVTRTGVIYQKLADIFDLVRRGLQKARPVSMTRGGQDMLGTALHCAADLVASLGPSVDDYLDDLLQEMFASGLSEDLINCLHSIALSRPSHQRVIEERLLREISTCLAGTPSADEICNPLSPLGRTKIERAPRSPNVNESSMTLNMFMSPQKKDIYMGKRSADQPVGTSETSLTINMSDKSEVIQKLVLSLQTLGSFAENNGMVTIGGAHLPILPFVRDVVAPYLSHPAAEVRRSAALTTCALLVPLELTDTGRRSREDTKTSLHVARKRKLGVFTCEATNQVLLKVLQVAVSDTSPVVRLCIVRALDERYNLFLCQGRLLQPLFFLLNDEAIETRAAGLQLLGRLSTLNPGPILPFMRQLLINLIVELRCGGDTGRSREEATHLLVVYLRCQPLRRLVQPVLATLVGALPLKGVAPRLASAALETLGELATASSTSLTPWVKELMPIVIETMQDESSASKQKTCWRTLGQIAGSTGYVIKPYLEYPTLLSLASDTLPTTKRAPWALRCEVIRTLGIIGALDPDQYRTFVPKTRKGGAVGGGYFVERDGDDRGRDGVGHFSLRGTFEAGTKAVAIPSFGADHVSGPSRKASVASLTEEGNIVKEDDDNMPAHLYMYEQYAMVAQPVSKILPAQRMIPSDEDFYPTVAVQALTRTFKDPSLAVHHGMAMQAIMFIFNHLGEKSVPFLKKVVPHFLYTIKTSTATNLREALLKQLASLSTIVGEHLRPYVAEIFEIVDEFWTTRHLGTILTLVAKIAVGVPDDFRRFLPILIRKLLLSLEEVQTSEWLAPVREDARSFEKLGLIFRSIKSLRGVLQEYLHLLVPALLKLTDSLLTISSGPSQTNSENMAVAATRTLAYLIEDDKSNLGVRQVSVPGLEMPDNLLVGSSLSALAAQPLIRLLSRETTSSKEVGHAIIEAICVCSLQLGKKRWLAIYHDFAYRAIISWSDRYGTGDDEDSVLSRRDSRGTRRKLFGLKLYESITLDIQSVGLQRIASSTGLTPDTRRDSFMESRNARTESFQSLGDRVGALVDSGDQLQADLPTNTLIHPVIQSAKRHMVNQANLQRAWDVSQRVSREDWDEWMRRFALTLLKEAPSSALRATASLAHAYQPLARELFSAAFVCCWEELDEQYRRNLVQALQSAFIADSVSPEILQTLLNLAEFMEHDGVGSGLPIDTGSLAELALKCRAYAKALHYKEREYNDGGPGAGYCVEALISINKKLDLPEAALGVLKTARVNVDTFNSSLYRTGSDLSDPLSTFRNHYAEELLYGAVSSTDDRTATLGSPGFPEIQESWLAKLGSWTEALAIYEEKLRRNPSDFEAILGCMRCHDASGEWQRVLDLARSCWPALSGSMPHQTEGNENRTNQFDVSYVNPKMQKRALKFCSQAAWQLGQWDELEKYASELVGGGVGTHSQSIHAGNITRDGEPTLVDFDGAYFSAVLHIHRQQWSLAARAVDAARQAMNSRFAALMAESYKRAYSSMVKAQTLAEMEEIIAFRRSEIRSHEMSSNHPMNRPNVMLARQQLLSVWRKRLAGCRFDADVHSSIMAVRSLVLGPTDEVQATLTLSDLSRQAQRYKLAERVLLDPLADLGANLNGPVFGFSFPPALGLGYTPPGDTNTVVYIEKLLGGDPTNILPQYSDVHLRFARQLIDQAGGLNRLRIQHQLYFAYIKHLWALDSREEAMYRLERLCDAVDVLSYGENASSESTEALKVACFLELGEYKLEETLSPTAYIPDEVQSQVLYAFKRATLSPQCGYRAWHVWALLNFRIAEQLNETEDATGRRQRSAPASMRHHIIAAVRGFVNAISLGTKRWSASVQQDLLNLLTCLFKYGELSEVATTIHEGIDSIALEAWLGVLPQLLARIHIRKPTVRSVLHPLLTKLGASHPQALMYPLSVLLKSPVAERKSAAESLMTTLKAHSNELVEEALMVSSELIRVAILWLEVWHEGLEDASRLYFGEGNVSGMLELLLPLHERVESGAETQKEAEFIKSFGRDLAEAHAYVKEYVRLVNSGGSSILSQGIMNPDVAGNEFDLARQTEEAETAMNKAWDIYYTVFRWINKQLPALTKLELSNCSPALSQAHNLELGVPGSYRVDGSYVKIEKFIPNVQVITSKQRPRKITLRGSDGKDYVFLLKGHEDLRQDERVMQLFGLVNALLARDRQTKKLDLNIQRYAICPLSHNCGIVGWLNHTDTLHSLIRDYRQTKRIPLNMENREMLKITPDYDLLSVMQKVEVFSDALRRTTGNGNDLYEILWLKSTNSEEWLERRTRFTRSLAVMSMVGYILGLGDRHPSNLMVDAQSGRVLHIDFGDCFEVAMNREKYPEKIPFRLTRMLVKAMEVSGIEGSYRTTCEKTMTVLRDSRDSLVAMLEAFVYDPLISWRLAGLSNGDASGERSPGTTIIDTTGHPSTIDRLSDSEEEGGMPTDVSKSVLNEPIAEAFDEEDDDCEEGQQKVEATSRRTEAVSLSDRIQEGSRSAATSMHEAGMSAARARSLQMFSNIQTLAANLGNSSRIASITGEGNERVAAEGSIAKSRIARSLRQKEVMSLLEGEAGEAHEELLNEKALKVIRRVQDKLSGTDMADMDDDSDPLDVSDQVQRLIVQATSSENLCQLFIGWCAFW